MSCNNNKIASLELHILINTVINKCFIRSATNTYVEQALNIPASYTTCIGKRPRSTVY